MGKNKQYTIGIDIGGTKMHAVLFDGAKVIADFTLATPKDNLEHFIIMIKALLEPLEEKAHENKMKIKGIGLGVAGVIDYKENKMLRSPNIPIIDNIKLTEKIEETIGYPILMDNDANCFLRAESRMGAGKEHDNNYGLIIGTGIGGSWWLNGEIYKGVHGGAGEPGEMIIDYNEELGLEDAYHKLTQSNPAHMAVEAYRGDVLAQKVFEEVGQYFGITMANIVNLINPEIFIIGGGVVESSDLFLAKAKKTMTKYINSTVAAKKVKVLKGKLGKDAGAIGAAMLIE